MAEGFCSPQEGRLDITDRFCIGEVKLLDRINLKLDGKVYFVLELQNRHPTQWKSHGRVTHQSGGSM